MITSYGWSSIFLILGLYGTPQEGVTLIGSGHSPGNFRMATFAAQPAPMYGTIKDQLVNEIAAIQEAGLFKKERIIRSNLYEPEKIKSLGINYFSIGRN